MAKCSVCIHPHVGDINAAIRAGERSLADITREHSLSDAALKRHRTLGHPDVRGEYNPSVDADPPVLPASGGKS